MMKNVRNNFTENLRGTQKLVEGMFKMYICLYFMVFATITALIFD